MDWPVIGSLTGVAVLSGALGIGAFAALRSDGPSTAGSRHAPALIAAMPSRLSPYPDARPAYPQMPAVRPPQLTVEDANGSERPAEPAKKKPSAVSPPPKEKPEVHRPPAVAKSTPKTPDDRTEADHHDKRVMTARKIAQLRAALRLLPDQVAHWRPVEAILREIGREQIAQVARGKQPEVGTGIMMRLYYAAQPLLGTLQPDQKERVRAMARSLGYGSVASML